MIIQTPNPSFKMNTSGFPDFFQKLSSVFSGFIFLISLLLLGGGIFFSGASPAFAADPVFTGGGLKQGTELVREELEESGSDISTHEGGIIPMIVEIINYFLTFVGIILTIIIIYAGIKIIFSQGEDEELGKAKNMILYAAIGVVIIVMSFGIVRFISNIANEASQENFLEEQGGNNQTSGGGTVEGGTSGTTTNEADLPSGTGNQDIDIEEQGDNIIETITDLQEIVDDGGKVQRSDITEISDQIDTIYNNAPQSEELDSNKETLDNLLIAIAKDPTNIKLLNQLELAVEQFMRTVEKIPEVRARIVYTYSSKTTPVTISLSGDQSYVQKKTGKVMPTLSENDYSWHVIGPQNKVTQLGNKMNTSFNIPNDGPGRYTFYLTAVLKNEAGEKISFPGNAQFSFVANEPSAQLSFTASGGKKSGLQMEYTEEENAAGITFTPIAVPKTGREIILYRWKINGRIFETKDPESIDFTFSKTGTHTVSLTVEDNAGVQTTTSNQVIIKKAVAYFDLQKGIFQIGEEVFFSGSDSKTTAGYIVEYKWSIFNSEDILISTSTDKDWSDSFTAPGKHNAKLTIVDNNENTATYNKVFYVASKQPNGQFSFTTEEDGYPATITFDARKSFDYADAPLTYSWDFNTDGVFEEENISSPIIEHTYSEAGKHIVTLKVTNQFNRDTLVQKNITIRSTLNAEIEVSPEVSHADTPITFTPKSNRGNAFEWDFGDGRVETIGKDPVVHLFEKAGRYRVQMTVNDEQNEKISLYKNVFIAEKDTPISVVTVQVNNNTKEYTEDICGAGKDGYEVLRSDSVVFSAEKSLNRDGSAKNIEYLWEFPNNTAFDKSTVKWVFPEISDNDCFPISLVVQDIHTKKLSEKETLYFSVKNSLPKISGFFITEPKDITAPASISLSVKASDTDGKIKKYSWWATQRGGDHEKIGLHSTLENKTILIIPRTGEEGDKQQYVFHVEAEDNSGGKTLSDDELGESISIETKTEADKSPIVTLLQDKKTIKMGDTVVFTAHAIDWGKQDINDTATFKWDFDGDNIFDDSSSGAIVAHKYKKFGNIIPRVKVIHNGLATSKEGAVTVEKTEMMPRAAFLYKKTPDTTSHHIQFTSNTSIFDETVTGNALRYEWDFNTDVDSDGDGESNNDIDTTDKNPEFTYDLDTKSAKVLLRIFDSVGGEDTVSHKVQFSEISGVIGGTSTQKSSVPIAAFLVQKDEENLHHLEFSANTSKFDTNVLDNTLSYAWDFNLLHDSDGDGNSKNDVDSTDKNPEFTYDKQLTFAKIQLIVTDSQDKHDSVHHTIEFLKDAEDNTNAEIPESENPRAAFLVQTTDNTDTISILFSADNSDFDERVFRNSLLYEWDFNLNKDSDGDGNPKNDVDSTDKNPRFTYDKTLKSAKVKLTVTDIKKNTDTVSHTIDFTRLSENNTMLFDARVWLGDDGENGRGLHLKLDEVTGKWKNIGDQEFFFNADTEEWVKSFTNSNGVTERIAFAFDEDEQRWYDSSSTETPEGLKLVYDEMTRKWINVGDPAFQKNDDTGEWEKIDEQGNIIPKEEYKNSQGGGTPMPQSSTNETWAEVIKRIGGNINESLRILTTTSSTKLDLYGGEKTMTKEEEFQVFAFIKNLDGSLYEGPVVFSVLSGEGSFSAPTVQSIGGRASTLFTAHTIGSVVIKASSPDTISHEISETLRYEILDNE